MPAEEAKCLLPAREGARVMEATTDRKVGFCCAGRRWRRLLHGGSEEAALDAVEDGAEGEGSCPRIRAGIAVSCGCGPTSPEPNSYILILNGRTEHIQLRVRKTTQPSLFCSFVFVAAQTRHLYPLIMVMATLLSGATATAISGRRTLHVTCSQQPSTRSACLRLGLAAVLLQPQRDVAYAAADEPEPANNGVPPASAQNSKQYVIQFFLRFTYSLFILYSILQRKEANKLLCLPATEEINNAETGTRSFLKKGIYMADIGPSLAAHAHRHRPPGAGRQGRLQLRQQAPPPQVPVHLHGLRL
jgi:hypothetical protein